MSTILWRRNEPCTKDLLADCQRESEQDFIVLESHSSLYRYRISEIIYAQSLDKYITLFLTESRQTESIRYKMSDLDVKLPMQGFSRPVFAGACISVKISFTSQNFYCPLFRGLYFAYDRSGHVGKQPLC